MFVYIPSFRLVLHHAGPGADPRHGHRLTAEGHLRHVRQAMQQGGGLQHAVRSPSGGLRGRMLDEKHWKHTQTQALAALPDIEHVFKYQL